MACVVRGASQLNGNYFCLGIYIVSVFSGFSHLLVFWVNNFCTQNDQITLEDVTLRIALSKTFIEWLEIKVPQGIVDLD